MNHTAENLPTLILTDLNVKGEVRGYQFIQSAQSISKQMILMVFSMHAESAYIQRALELGASGYILKSSPSDEVIRAIEGALDGKRQSTALTSVIPQVDASIIVLSPREREVAQWVSAGLSSKQIAEQLNISFRTVECHRQNIMKKLNVSNTVQLVTRLNNLNPQF